MRKTKKMISLMLAATVSIGMLSGCGGNSDTKSVTSSGNSGVSVNTSNDSENKVLTFGCQMYDDGSLNSALQVNGSWNCMRYGISEALFKFNDNMEVEPWLAESYEVSDDHKTWTIKLKKGIKFSDGCELTASKVKAAFDYIKKVGPSGIAKPENYLEYEAKITADDEAGIVTIETSKPYINLAGQLAYPVMAILDVEHMKDFDNDAIGTGPYMVDKFNGVGVGYHLVANPNYYEDVPYDEVNILYMGDNSAKAMALQSGQVDLVENITNVSDIKKFQEDENYTVDIAAGVRCGFSWMNFNGVLKNKTLRQAIIMGTDYDTICNSKTIGGLYTPGFSVLPSNLKYGYENLNNPYKYDPEGAKKLLDDAGIVDTDGDGIREIDGKNINLVYVSYENRLLNDFSDAHTQYLNELGIGVTSDYTNSDEQWKKLVAGEYDLNNNNWSTIATGDPVEFMVNWSTDGTYCGYSNPDYDELYKQLEEETDKNKRKDIIQKLQQILIDDAAVLIDGYYNSSMIYSKNVAKAHIHTADYYWLTTEIIPAE